MQHSEQAGVVRGGARLQFNWWVRPYSVHGPCKLPLMENGKHSSESITFVEILCGGGNNVTLWAALARNFRTFSAVQVIKILSHPVECSFLDRIL